MDNHNAKNMGEWPGYGTHPKDCPCSMCIVLWIIESTAKEIFRRGYDLTNSENVFENLCAELPDIGESVRRFFLTYVPAYQKALEEFSVGRRH
jgi:hypothetical protein